METTDKTHTQIKHTAASLREQLISDLQTMSLEQLHAVCVYVETDVKIMIDQYPDATYVIYEPGTDFKDDNIREMAEALDAAYGPGKGTGRFPVFKSDK